MLSWTFGYIYLFKLVFSVLFSYMPRSGIARLHISSIFGFLEKPLYHFHSSFTHLHFHWQCIGILFSPHSHQHLLFVFFLVITIMLDMKWYFIVVLVFLSLIIFEHLFMYLLAHAFPFWKNAYSNGLLPISKSDCFLMLSCVCILKINHLLFVLFVNIFSHLVICLFILSMVSFAVQKF